MNEEQAKLLNTLLSFEEKQWQVYVLKDPETLENSNES